MSCFLFFLIASSGIYPLIMPITTKGTVAYYSGAVGDEAIFYNPANLETDERFRLSCFYGDFYVSTRSFSLSVSKKLKVFDFGVGIMNFDYGDIELRPDYPTEDTVTSYTGSDFMFIICGARKISPQGKLGLGIKYISENIYIYSDHTVAFDFSLTYRNEIGSVSVGTTNLGYPITIKNEEVKLPTKLSLGLSRKFNEIILGFDLHYLVNGGQFEFSMAGDFPTGRYLQTGVALNYHQMFYPGFNLVFNLPGLAIKYGGAVYPYDLGLIHNIGISFLF